MAQARSNVAIIGGGIMGGDIAAVFAAGDWSVHVVDAAEKARSTLPARLGGALGKLGASADKAANVKAYAGLEALPWQDIELVVEAVTENLALKQKLFSQHIVFDYRLAVHFFRIFHVNKLPPLALPDRVDHQHRITFQRQILTYCLIGFSCFGIAGMTAERQNSRQFATAVTLRQIE